MRPRVLALVCTMLFAAAASATTFIVTHWGPEALTLWIDRCVARDSELEIKRWDMAARNDAVDDDEIRSHLLNLPPRTRRVIQNPQMVAAILGGFKLLGEAMITSGQLAATLGRTMSTTVKTAATVCNLGVPSMQATDMAGTISVGYPAGGYGLILLSIGTNDIYFADVPSITDGSIVASTVSTAVDTPVETEARVAQARATDGAVGSRTRDARLGVADNRSTHRACGCHGVVSVEVIHRN